MLFKENRITRYTLRITDYALRVTNNATFTLVVVLLPALSRWFLPQLPGGPDFASHFFRAVELDWLIRHGILYSRWLPDFVFGYGYPLFNFYGPLSAYLIVGFHFLGLPFIPATLAVFALADLLGAFGAYLLARDTLGKLPGLVAAVAYAYSPYTLASLYRGALPEALVFGLLPLTLWAFYRLHSEPSPARFVFASILLATLPLLNNPAAVLSVAGLVVFISVLWLNQHTTHNAQLATRSLFTVHSPLLAVFCSLFTALALSAFFWLPLLFEIQYVQIDRAFGPAITNYRANFLSLEKLFALPQTVDPDMLGASAVSGLGLPQIALALAALFFIRRRSREQKFLLAFYALAALGFTSLTLPQSVWVWDTLPGLRFVQLPPRLLGPSSLMLALLCGSAFAPATQVAATKSTTPAFADSVAAGRLRAFVAAVSTATLLLFSLGWLYTGGDRAIPPQPIITDIHIREHRTGVVGATAALEFLPVWVEQKPPDNSLQTQYAESPVINRLDLNSMPADATLISQTPGLLSQKVDLESPSDFTAVFNLFYFPGWTATVDGEAAPIAPAPINGLVSFPVPAGRHTLELQFTDTPPRTIGNLISLVALLALVTAALRGGLSLRDRPAMLNKAGDGLRRSHWVAIAGVGLAAILIKLLIVDRGATPFFQKRFDGQSIAGVQHPLDLAFGGQLQLLGYDERGGEVILYWRALQELDSDWSVSVTLDYEGHRVAQNDSQHPGGLPTSRWFPDQYARDVHPLTPIPGAPPGAYDLRVTVYRQSDGVILQPASVKIGNVFVRRPPQPALLEPSKRVSVRLSSIELIGVDVPAQINSGQTLPITLYWRANETPAQDIQTELQLISRNSNIYVGKPIVPWRTDFGASQWRAGDTWIGFVDLLIGADLPGGDYQLAIMNPNGPTDLVHIRVIAPDRVFAVPPIAHPLNVQFGEITELLGWQYTDNQFALYWHSLQITDVSYTVFVHALNANGDIIAQRDNPPANGTRLTTSWLPPEIITDVYDLPLPPNTTAIRVGLYDPKTGERLRLPDGAEFVVFSP